MALKDIEVKLNMIINNINTKLIKVLPAIDENECVIKNELSTLKMTWRIIM